MLDQGADLHESLELRTLRPPQSPSRRQSHGSLTQRPSDIRGPQDEDAGNDTQGRITGEAIAGTGSPGSLHTLSPSQSPSRRQSQRSERPEDPDGYGFGQHNDVGNGAEPETKPEDVAGRRSHEQDDPGTELATPAEEVEAKRAPPRTSAELRDTVAAAHHERMAANREHTIEPLDDRPITPVPSLESGLESFWNITKPRGEQFQRALPPQSVTIQEEQVDDANIHAEVEISDPHTFSPYTDSAPTQKEEQWNEIQHPDSAAPSTLPTRPAPDRGHSAWLQAWANFFTTFSTHGFPLAFGILLPFYGYVPLLGHSAAAVTVIGSLSLGAPFLASRLVERLLAAGYFRYVFHGGSLGLVGALVGSSFCTSLGCFLATEGVLVALTGSCVFCTGVLVLQTYFENNAGRAMSVGAAGASVGGVVYTVLTQQLLPVIGLHWTLRALSLVALLSLLFPNVVVRPRQHQPDKRTDGAEEAADDQPGNWDAEFVLLGTGLVVVFLTLHFPYYYLPTFAILSLSTNPTRASFLLLTLIAVTIPSRILARPLAARLGLFNTLSLATVVSSASTMLLIPTTTIPSLHLVAACYGIGSAGILALYSTAVAAVNMGRGAGQAKRRRGVVWTGMGIATIAGPVVAGALMEVGVRSMGNERGFVAVQLWAGACLAAGGACFLGVRVVRAGWGVVRV